LGKPPSWRRKAIAPILGAPDYRPPCGHVPPDMNVPSCHREGTRGLGAAIPEGIAALRERED